MKDSFLPIGSIVLLKNGTKKIMVTGYLPISNDNGQKTIFDYSACLFPEGILSSDKTAAFNHDQIAEVIHEGYSNEETEKFTEALLDILNKENDKTIGEIVKESVPAPAEALDMPMETTTAPENMEMPTENAVPVEPEPAPVEEPVEQAAPEPMEMPVETSALDIPAEPPVEMPVEAPAEQQPAPFGTTPMEDNTPVETVEEQKVEEPQDEPTPDLDLPVVEAPIVGDSPVNPLSDIEAPVVDMGNVEPTPDAPVETPTEESVEEKKEEVSTAEAVESLDINVPPVENTDNTTETAEDETTNGGEQTSPPESAPVSVGVDSIKPFSE